ncbi:hypothetical protein BDN70DRAFT_876339 [Pholiota conissans]|uniref:Uncharacterized protein n=1 Tax=Pholiota conissans TaxID=109636 RepID=A0A9P5Z726_9AGAR|nr:hypothetical protein BDN70DRAFT_876339 [Pholiota conissans]
MSPIIPGAWSPTWTLDSQEDNIVDTQKTRRVTDTHPSCSGFLQRQGSHSFNPASTETPNLKGWGGSIEKNAHTCKDDAVSFADDASSIPSDDFYSFISHEDTESTLFPSVIMSASSIPKEKDHATGLLDPLDFSSSHFEASELSSHLYASSHDNVYASTKPPSETSIFAAVAPSTEDDTAMENRRFVNALGLSSQNISAGNNEFTLDAVATAIDAVTHTSGNDSPVDPQGYECDSSSSHSVSLSISGHIPNIIARLSVHHSVSHRSSEHSWSRSSSRNQSPRSTHRGHIDNSLLFRAQVNHLQLSQPNGDDPWTLSLDPTVSSEATPEASTASLSVGASLRRYSGVSRESLASIASFHSSSPHNSPCEEDITTTPQGSESAKYDAPLRHRFNSGPSPLVYGRSNDSVRSKNIIQKTKELCSKFKNFISLKAIKERKSKDEKGNLGILRRTHLTHQVDNDASFHRHDFPRMASESVLSLENHHAFRRTAKTSSPSVALSSTPNYTISGCSSGEKYTYEYHARPKTLQEIRSKYRFSLPTFARPTSPTPPNSRTINPIPSMRQRRAGSILSQAEGSMAR